MRSSQMVQSFEPVELMAWYQSVPKAGVTLSSSSSLRSITRRSEKDARIARSPNPHKVDVLRDVVVVLAPSSNHCTDVPVELAQHLLGDHA